MKKNLIAVIIALLNAISILAIPISGFKYQGVLRNNQGVVIENSAVLLKISILQGAENGTSVYSEQHEATTNAFGLVNVIIGSGTSPMGDFSTIDWSGNSYFLKVEMAVVPNTTLELLGVSPLLSVPYALHAETVTKNEDADADPVNEIQQIILTGTTLSISQANSVDLTPLLTTDTDDQTLTLIDDQLSITNGNSVDLAPYKDNTDAQNLNLAGTTLSISGGNTVDLSTLPDLVNDADADPTNELQLLSIANDSLILSKGNKVGLPKQDVLWDNSGTTLFYNDGNVGIGTGSPKGKLEVKGSAVTNPDEIIFGVLNNTGDTVFAVYQGGVRINVDDNAVKGTGSRGGFAVGGFSTGKGLLTNEYLRVTPDSVRVYFDDTQKKVAGSRGGFAVGGFSTGKVEGSSYMYLEPDNYFIGQESGKSIKNGLYNSFLGYQTGYSTTDASNNVFLGYQAGLNNTTGGDNVFLGTSSGYANTNGVSNVFLGFNAGYTNNASFNTFIGYQAGKANTSGQFNSFMGYNTGLSNTTGGTNVFIGNESGRTNTTGASNVFLGNLAGYTNNASNNAFIGNESGRYNTTGADNAFMGYFAGRANTTGYSNVFIGKSSGANNTTGYSNLFIGDESGLNTTTGFSNLFLGENSGYSNQTGQHNVFIGRYAGYSGTALKYNIFIGDSAGYLSNATFATNNVFIGYAAGKNTQSYNNIFVGNQAGWSNSGGQNNIAIGDKAGYSNTTSQNIFIGTEAGWKNTTGFFNIIMGRWAAHNLTTGSQQIIIGGGAGGSLTTGGENVIIGTNAGSQNDGDRNIFIGNSAGWSNTGSNNIIMGYKVGYAYFQTVSNRLIIDNSQVAVPLVWGEFDNRRFAINATDPTQTLDVNGNARIRTIGSGAYFGVVNRMADGTLTTSTSDVRLKENINTLTNSLSNVLKLRGVSFNWKKEPQMGLKIGFIAQEVEQVLPELVFTNEVDGFKGVNYAEITAVLTEAIKEQQKQIEALIEKNKEIDTLLTEAIKEQQKQIEALIEKNKETDTLKAELAEIKALLKK